MQPAISAPSTAEKDPHRLLLGISESKPMMSPPSATAWNVFCLASSRLEQHPLHQ